LLLGFCSESGGVWCNTKQAYNYIKISLILHSRSFKTSLFASVKLKTTQTLIDGSRPIILQILKPFGITCLCAALQPVFTIVNVRHI